MSSHEEAQKGKTKRQKVDHTPIFDEQKETYYELPDDILIEVLSYLAGKHVCKCSLVCKSWNKCTSEQCIWAPLARKRWKHPNKVLFPRKCQDTCLEYKMSDGDDRMKVDWKALYKQDNGWRNGVECRRYNACGPTTASNVPRTRSRRINEPMHDINDFAADEHSIVYSTPGKLTMCDHNLSVVKRIRTLDVSDDISWVTLTDEHVMALASSLDLDYSRVYCYSRGGSTEETFHVLPTIYPQYFMFFRDGKLYADTQTGALFVYDIAGRLVEETFYASYRTVALEVVDQYVHAIGLTNRVSQKSEITIHDKRMTIFDAQHVPTHKRLRSIHCCWPYIYTTHFKSPAELWDVRTCKRVHKISGMSTKSSFLVGGDEDVLVGAKPADATDTSGVVKLWKCDKNSEKATHFFERQNVCCASSKKLRHMVWMESNAAVFLSQPNEICTLSLKTFGQ